MADNRRRKSLVWPLVLISLGVLFLLNNLGIVSWSIWSLLWRMWPVLLVAIGLDLIFGRRSGIWQAITVIVIIGLFAGAFWLFDVTENTWSGEKVTYTIVQEIGKAEDVDVNIKMNIGSLSLNSLPTNSDFLVTGEVEVSEFEDLTDELLTFRDKSTYRLSSDGQQYHPGWIFNRDGNGDKHWELMLNQDVMLNLEVDTGVGITELDLSDLLLKDLNINSGVGEVTVYMPGRGDYQASVKAGVGKLEIYLPNDLAAQIFIDGGLGNVTVIGDFIQRNGNYYTRNYNSSEEQIELFIDGGVGNIRIVQTD